MRFEGKNMSRVLELYNLIVVLLSPYQSYFHAIISLTDIFEKVRWQWNMMNSREEFSITQKLSVCLVIVFPPDKRYIHGAVSPPQSGDLR